MKPLTPPRKVPKKALVVGAHPDDCDFGAGGTAWEWVQKGWEVFFLVATDGSRGTADLHQDRGALARRRKEEQETSAAHLGVTQCHFLGYEDGALVYGESLVRDLVKVLRVLRPSVVFTHTPAPLDYRPFNRKSGASVNHRDHRALALATLDALYPSARDPLFFPELGLAPHIVSDLYLWGDRDPDVETVLEGGLDRKAEALALHKTQFPAADWGQLKEFWGSRESFLSVTL